MDVDNRYASKAWEVVRWLLSKGSAHLSRVNADWIVEEIKERKRLRAPLPVYHNLA